MSEKVFSETMGNIEITDINGLDRIIFEEMEIDLSSIKMERVKTLTIDSLVLTIGNDVTITIVDFFSTINNLNYIAFKNQAININSIIESFDNKMSDLFSEHYNWQDPTSQLGNLFKHGVKQFSTLGDKVARKQRGRFGLDPKTSSVWGRLNSIFFTSPLLFFYT